MYVFGSVTYTKWFHFFSGKELWLGYRRVDGVWGWADCSTVDYTNFDPSDTSHTDPNKNCMSFNDDGSWQYSPCDSEYRPLCIYRPGIGNHVDRELPSLETVVDYDVM